ncbi:chromate transporter [Paraburkholderia sp. JPY432]|nr:chromate transporter [Paraburkholderia youngii]
MFEGFYRSGALVFGGGHVVLPLLQQETVATGWVSSNDFLAGNGAAQAVPGPLFTFAAFLGWIMLGRQSPAWGALLTTAGIFLPGLLLVLAALPSWQALRARPSMAPCCPESMQPSSDCWPPPCTRRCGPAPCTPSLTSQSLSSVFFLLMRCKVPPLVVVVLWALAGIAEAVLH